MNKSVMLLLCLVLVKVLHGQVTEYRNGQWWINNHFVATTIYADKGVFSFKKPLQIDSSVDLKGRFCIPPFGDAHTHNLDGSYGLQEMVKQYLKDGVFYVQVLGNHGTNAGATRSWLAKEKSLDVSYANGLLTATYGHGFYPYEPLAMGIYRPVDQFRYADSIKKSRLAENDAYYFLDSIADVEAKWPLIIRYKPDHIKICLLDAAGYDTLRKAEKMETYGLSPAVAGYIVQKAHAAGLRVFAHVETAGDARLAAAIGVDVLAHLPGYGWNGLVKDKEKYCLTKADLAWLKKSGMAVIPTLNIDATTEYDSAGNPTEHPDRYERTLGYKKAMVKALYDAGVPLALGADYYGKTVSLEMDWLTGSGVFGPAQLLDIFCRQTPRHIFPKRKLGEIREGYEASFLVLQQNPLLHIRELRTVIVMRVKQGRVLAIP